MFSSAETPPGIDASAQSLALIVLPAELTAEEAALAAEIEQQVRAFLKNSKSLRTWKAYESDWADFTA